jgi:hypothetical protein
MNCPNAVWNSDIADDRSMKLLISIAIFSPSRSAAMRSHILLLASDGKPDQQIKETKARK